MVNLNNEGYATDDDIKYHRNLWARFFKAKTWEDNVKNELNKLQYLLVA